MEDLNLSWQKRRMPGCQPYSYKRILRQGKTRKKLNKKAHAKRALRRLQYARAMEIMMNTSPEKFTFFWKAHSPFSQFYRASFHGMPMFNVTDKDQQGYNFLHCEQWMMYNKAKLFGDEPSAKLILDTMDPPDCKLLGRRVANFNEVIWKENNEAIITEGNRLKFSQNRDILKVLLSTEGTTLAEASPFDRIYGIGLSAKNPAALNRKKWRGKNLLGEVLTKLREELKEKMGTTIYDDTSSDEDTSDYEATVGARLTSR